jgi:hypothetical protein
MGRGWATLPGSRPRPNPVTTGRSGSARPGVAGKRRPPRVTPKRECGIADHDVPVRSSRAAPTTRSVLSSGTPIGSARPGAPVS